MKPVLTLFTEKRMMKQDKVIADIIYIHRKGSKCDGEEKY